MKFFLYTKWKYENYFLYISILSCFSLIAYYHLSSGFIMSSDSFRYEKWADILISFDFNLFEFFLIDKVPNRPPLFFSLIPVLLISLCKMIFVNDWQFVFFLLNLSFLFFSLIIFTKCLLSLGIIPVLISFAFPLILISVDVLTYPKFILSDMMYSFFVLISIYFVTEGILNNKINYLKILGIILLILASRPSSVPVIFAIILFFMISKFEFFLIKKNILILILSIFILTPLIFGFIYLFIKSNFNEVPKVEYLINMVNNGMVVHDRPNTWLDKPNNFIDIVFIYFLRLINFFNPYASTFSILHLILNFIQTFSILLSIAIWSFFGNHQKVQNKFFLFIMLLSISVAAFHSFILIDYDWRYRFPIILPLLMLFPTALEILFKRIKIN